MQQEHFYDVVVERHRDELFEIEEKQQIHIYQMNSFELTNNFHPVSSVTSF